MIRLLGILSLLVFATSSTLDATTLTKDFRGRSFRCSFKENMPNNHMDCAVRRFDGEIWHVWRKKGGKYGKQRFPDNGIWTDVACIHWGDKGQVSCLGADQEGVVWHSKAGSDRKFSVWFRLGGYWGTAPDCFSWPGDHFQCFALDQNREIQYNSYKNGKFSLAFLPGRQFKIRPVCSRRSEDAAVCIAIGMAGKFWYFQTFNRGETWEEPEIIPAVSTTIYSELPTCTTMKPNGFTDCFVRRPAQGTVDQLRWNGKTSWTVKNIGGKLGSPPTCRSFLGTGNSAREVIKCFGVTYKGGPAQSKFGKLVYSKSEDGGNSWGMWYGTDGMWPKKREVFYHHDGPGCEILPMQPFPGSVSNFEVHCFAYLRLLNPHPAIARKVQLMNGLWGDWF